VFFSNRFSNYFFALAAPRRVYLDAIGALPTPEEAAQFLKDPDPAGRAALIGRLLGRALFSGHSGQPVAGRGGPCLGPHQYIP
jgi:hypothetical protein